MSPAAGIYVVMATRNGERFVGEQIDSIRRQSVRDWTLLVRDDLSADETVDLLERAARRDSRIRLLPSDGEQPLGPRGNFGLLLERAAEEGAEAVFLADQDDFWRPEKMERLLVALGESSPMPTLVFSDLEVTDESLESLRPSFMRHQRTFPVPGAPLGPLLVQNFVTGCASVVNRALLELALPIPEAVRNHDWWLAVVAAAAGNLVYRDEPLVRYRQHGRNVVGAWRPAALFPRPMARARDLVSRHRQLLRNNAAALAELTARLEALGGAAAEPVRQIETFRSVIDARSSRLAKLHRLEQAGIRPLSRRRTLLLALSL